MMISSREPKLELDQSQPRDFNFTVGSDSVNKDGQKRPGQTSSLEGEYICLLVHDVHVSLGIFLMDDT